MSYYNDDDDSAGAGLGYILAITILLMPVIPIGDIAVYLVDAYTIDSPNYVYILSWILLAFCWSLLFFSIALKFIESFTLLIILFYLQGFLFGILVGNSQYAWWSKIIAGLAQLIFVGN